MGYLLFVGLLVLLVGGTVLALQAGQKTATLQRDKLVALAGALGLRAEVGVRVPIPASSGLGGAFVVTSGRGGYHVLQCAPGYKGFPRRTLVARYVGDFPGVLVSGERLPCLTVNPRGQLGAFYSAMIGKGVETGDPRVDSRFSIHVFLSMGFAGPSMIEGRMPVPPDFCQALLQLPPSEGFYFDGQLAVVSFVDWDLDPAALATAFPVLEAFSRYAAWFSAWRLSAR